MENIERIRYHQLGRTGMVVSEMGFGGAPAGLRNYLGHWDPEDRASEESIITAIHKAVEMGINYFDTAPGYGDGASEIMFGNALQPYRKKIFIATKAFTTSRDDILRSVEGSLRRLKTEYIDVMQIHGTWFSDEQVRQILGPEGSLEGLLSLQKQGVVRSIGFTTEGANGSASQLIASGAFDVIQVCYNLIFQHPFDPSRKAGILYEAEQRGMGIVSMRPLTSGTFQKWLESVFVDEMRQSASRQKINRSLLAFVLSNPLVDSVLVGMRTPGEVMDNIATCLNQDLRINLEELHNRYV